MIGPLEVLILLFIVLLIFHKRLPGLGRSAGKNAKLGTEKAREFADTNTPKAKELVSQVSTKSSEVGEKVGSQVSGKVDAGDLGRKAGKGLREARDIRSEFKSFLDPPPKQPKPPKQESAPAAKAVAPAAKAVPPPEPANDSDPADSDPPGPAADAERRPDSETSE